MHATSLENMQECYKRYLQPYFFDARESVTVLDIGSADVNGSYREIFSHPKVRYFGTDLTNAKGVDLVLESPYELPFGDSCIDVVISGQMLEHCEYFWMSFQEMVRVLKPDGFLFLIAPSAGPIHRYPVDCYRFYPDAYEALANLTNCYLVDSWLDERGQWKDLVGVFSKGPYTKFKEQFTEKTFKKRSGITKAYRHLASVFSKIPRGTRKRFENYKSDSGSNIVFGETSYLELLEIVHRELAPRSYLEIGVREGKSLKLSRCPTIGIDPAPELSYSKPKNITIYPKSSDEFFDQDAARVLPEKLDLAFIDGMHHFEFVLRDFINVERFSNPLSLVVVDDIFPNHPIQALRERESRVWTGDVWKLLGCLKTFRPDLTLLPVNSSPTGSLLIAGLDSSNRELLHNFALILKQFVMERNDPPPDYILNRKNAIDANDQQIIELLQVLRLFRDQRSGKLPLV